MEGEDVAVAVVLILSLVVYVLLKTAWVVQVGFALSSTLFFLFPFLSNPALLYIVFVSLWL